MMNRGEGSVSYNVLKKSILQQVKNQFFFFIVHYRKQQLIQFHWDFKKQSNWRVGNTTNDKLAGPQKTIA